MSGVRLFIDTNILLYYLKGNEDVVELISDNELNIFTKPEVLSFPNLTADDESQINGLFSNCTIIEPTQDIKDLTIELRKQYKLKLPDAIIAASAQILNLPLITADKDFTKLKGMNIILYENE